MVNNAPNQGENLADFPHTGRVTTLFLPTQAYSFDPDAIVEVYQEYLDEPDEEGNYLRITTIKEIVEKGDTVA